MKQYILLAFLFFSFSFTYAQYSVRGGTGTPYKSPSGNKLDVYLLYGMQGAQISYTSSDQEKHQWYRYATKANEADPIESEQVGNTSTITGVQDGYGYYVGSNLSPSTSYVWIIDYSKYLPVFQSININEGNDKCNKLTINASIDAADLAYYTPTGTYSILTREYSLSYTTMDWSEESMMYISIDKVDNIKTPSAIQVEKVFQDTDFTLSGDKYAEHFGVQKTMSTPVYQTSMVTAHKGPEKKDKEKVPNEFEKDTSGPIFITYNAYANEPVAAMYIWKIFFVPDGFTTSQSIARYTDKTISYNFEKDGVYTVQLEVIDRHGVCSDTSVVYNVTIGETEIKIPKAFSPGSSSGVNDEFRISYTSVVSFKCTIFNRWGTKLFEWNDPAKGWDGRVNGKFVPTGAYFYIMEYRTTSGKNKVKRGAVNILRSKY